MLRADDIDDDGDQDIIFASNDDFAVSVLWNDGNANFTLEVLVDNGIYQAVAVGDMNGDGFKDILGRSVLFEVEGNVDTIVCLFNDGNGGFNEEVIVFSDVPHGWSLELVDLDEDQD